MRIRELLLLLLGLAAARADELKPVFPGVDWEHVASPEAAGFSSAKLDVLRAWMKTQSTTAMVVSVGGRVLFEYGAVKQATALASARKSVLGMLYGKYLGNNQMTGTITLNRTVKDLGLDDVQKFLPIEEKATLRDLLMSRSGIYHPGGEEEPKDMCPVRGSQFPGTFFCYNNWDFDAAGTAFEKLAGKNIYDALESDLARPIGMQDFDRARQKKDPAMPYSVHSLYHMYLSTRDMARLGLLMLRGGNWDGKQLMNANWVQYMTTLVTR
jgi:CubicO group peptidase (beta-lactamase class C family)